MEIEFGSNQISICDYFENTDTIKISSSVLSEFVSRDANILINKADKDFWQLGENGDGDLIVERLF